MRKTALVVAGSGCNRLGPRVREEDSSQAPIPPAPVVPEAPPPAPPPVPRAEAPPQVDEYARLRAMSPEEIEKSGLLGEVYFEFNKADIRDADRATLTKNAAALKRFDFLRITIEGHCDERGTVEYNLALGERRAQRGLRLRGVARRARRPAQDRFLRQGSAGVPAVDGGVLAEEPPRPLHGDRQDEVARGFDSPGGVAF